MFRRCLCGTSFESLEHASSDFDNQITIWCNTAREILEKKSKPTKNADFASRSRIISRVLHIAATHALSSRSTKMKTIFAYFLQTGCTPVCLQGHACQASRSGKFRYSAIQRPMRRRLQAFRADNACCVWLQTNYSYEQRSDVLKRKIGCLFP